MGDDFWKDFVVGLVSGLVSVFIVWVWNEFWKKVMRPRWENLLYKGIEVAGTWSGKVVYPTGGWNKVRVKINRIGYNLTGSAYCEAGVDKGMSWKFCGSIRNSLVVLSYDSSNTRELDRGAICLKVVNGGRALQGIAAYFDETDDLFHSYEMELKLVNPDVTHDLPLEAA